MATFEAKVYKINIEEHPNADALEVACIGDYKCIVGKGSYNSGDLAVYIPEAAILPDWVISRLGLEGKLAGKQKNRVKAIKLRGVLSQGLVFPLDKREDGFYLVKAHSDKGILVKEGDVVTDVLGITKYEPPIPTHMNGEVFSAYGKTISYDIENIKKFAKGMRVPQELEEGLKKYDKKEDKEKVGLEFSAKLVEEIKKHGVFRGAHIYSPAKESLIPKLLDML